MALDWKHDKVSRSYSTRMPNGDRVTIRATGQRNGRTLGGAWRATTGFGRDSVDVARGGTLTTCKAAVQQIADRTCRHCGNMPGPVCDSYACIERDQRDAS